MHDITVIRRLNSPQQNERCEAMMEGLQAIGLNPVYNKGANIPIKTKRVAIWGWRIGPELMKNHDVLVMEYGYIGDRKRYTSLGWNGLNGYARFPEYPFDIKRFEALGGVIQPWKRGGQYALILGQLANDASLRGIDMNPLYQEWVKKLKLMDIPVFFRNHPEAVKHRKTYEIKGAPEIEGDLQTALKDAAFTVTFNSNSSVDSILAGVPCVTYDRGSMAYEMCVS